MIIYKTIATAVKTEQIIDRSRFIAHIAPVETREDAEAFVKKIKKEYKDATHNVPAFIIGEKQEIQWASDDGEPQGTSGFPMVQMLVNEGITNVAVVVTRYFGGVKLGTGGLVRAYTSSAKLAVEKAGIAAVEELTRLTTVIDYSLLDKVENLCRRESITIENREFAEKITMDFLTEKEKTASIKKLLMDLTNGNITWQKQVDEVVKRKIN